MPGLVPASDVAAAESQLFRLYPTPAEMASGERTERTAPFLDAPTGDPALDTTAIGFPPPGHDYWDTETLASTQDRYPALDLGPWRVRQEAMG